MFNDRMSNFKPRINPEHPGFVPTYEFTNRQTGISYKAPFPVAVYGIHHEIFGVGRVIGSVKGSPMIEIQDCETGKPVHVMGYESWWTTPVPEEVVTAISDGQLAVASVSAYRKRQDEYWA